MVRCAQLQECPQRENGKSHWYDVQVPLPPPHFSVYSSAWLQMGGYIRPIAKVPGPLITPVQGQASSAQPSSPSCLCLTYIRTCVHAYIPAYIHGKKVGGLVGQRNGYVATSTVVPREQGVMDIAPTWLIPLPSITPAPCPLPWDLPSTLCPVLLLFGIQNPTHTYISRQPSKDGL